jgi:hypothetical protein
MKHIGENPGLATPAGLSYWRHNYNWLSTLLLPPTCPTNRGHLYGNDVQLVGNNLHPGQGAEIQVTFTWETPGDAGCHKYHWEIYKEEKLIFKGEDKPYVSRSIPFDNPCFRFQNSPYLVKEYVKLPKGNFRYVLFVDGAETVNVPLKVVNKNYTYTLRERTTIKTEIKGSDIVTREIGKRLGDFETLDECQSALSKSAEGVSAESSLSCDRIGDDGLIVPPWRQ